MVSLISMQMSIYISEKLLLLACTSGQFLLLSISISFNLYQLLPLSCRRFIFGLELHTQIIPGSSLWCHYKILDFSLIRMKTRNEREVPCVRVCTWHCISLNTVWNAVETSDVMSTCRNLACTPSKTQQGMSCIIKYLNVFDDLALVTPEFI